MDWRQPGRTVATAELHYQAAQRRLPKRIAPGTVNRRILTEFPNWMTQRKQMPSRAKNGSSSVPDELIDEVFVEHLAGYSLSFG